MIEVPKFLIPILLLATGTPAMAVELVEGQVYPGSTRIEASELGVAFTMPAGWRGTWPAGSEVFLMQPAENPNALIVALGEEASREELLAMMSEPVDLGDGVILHPQSSPVDKGKAVAGSYQVTSPQGPREGYVEALAGDHGVSIAYVLIAAPGTSADYTSTVSALVSGTSLTAPKGEPAQQAGGAVNGQENGSDRWDVYLKGKYIVRYFTRSGYTDEEHIWLCSDGTFKRRGAAGGFGGGASGASQSDGAGKWTATGAGADGTLTLHYGDGSTGTYQLRWDYSENKLYVDGKRWFHDKNEVCS